MKKVQKWKFGAKQKKLANPIGLEGTCFQGKINRSSELGERRGNLNDTHKALTQPMFNSFSLYQLLIFKLTDYSTALLVHSNPLKHLGSKKNV